MVAGFLLAFGLNVLGVVLSGLSQVGDPTGGMLVAFFFAGLYQWALVLPLLVIAYATRRFQAAKGVWISAGLWCLPTAYCFHAMGEMR